MQHDLAVGLDKMQEAAESAAEMRIILAVQAKGGLRDQAISVWQGVANWPWTT
jgi:hypothetical protein